MAQNWQGKVSRQKRPSRKRKREWEEDTQAEVAKLLAIDNRKKFSNPKCFTHPSTLLMKPGRNLGLLQVNLFINGDKEYRQDNATKSRESSKPQSL